MYSNKLTKGTFTNTNISSKSVYSLVPRSPWDLSFQWVAITEGAPSLPLYSPYSSSIHPLHCAFTTIWTSSPRNIYKFHYSISYITQQSDILVAYQRYLQTPNFTHSRASITQLTPSILPTLSYHMYLVISLFSHAFSSISSIRHSQ